jgi:hypothetical protein
MAIYRLLCTKSKIAAVSMGHWTVKIIRALAVYTFIDSRQPLEFSVVS